MKLRAALIASLLVLAACAAPANMRHYTLLPESPPPATASAAPGYRVVIGPVTVPEQLDRMQIVLRVAPNRYVIADTERWAEPLKREIPRVLAQDVGRRLPAARVASDSQFGGEGADYRILIDVLRFESAPGESVTLEAAWSVRNRAGARLREANFVLVEKVSAAGVSGVVAAHAKALAALGMEIAAALDALAKPKR